MVVKGICLVAIICDYLAICLQSRDANAFTLFTFINVQFRRRNWYNLQECLRIQIK